MLTKRSKTAGGSSSAKPIGGSEAAGWEIRPGGMLVQKRNSDQNSVQVPKIEVKVKHGSSFHKLDIMPQNRSDKEMEKPSKAIAEIGLEVDKIAKQVSTLELEILNGKRVAETSLLSLTELLMTQLLKLDEVVADGEAKVQRRDQVRRVQKYIEILDMLKMKVGGKESKAPI